MDWGSRLGRGGGVGAGGGGAGGGGGGGGGGGVEGAIDMGDVVLNSLFPSCKAMWHL